MVVAQHQSIRIQKSRYLGIHSLLLYPGLCLLTSCHQVNKRDQIQANLRSLHSFGNGWWFHSKNTQIFCHDKSLTNGNKDDCAKTASHIATVKRYKDGHDATMFCESNSEFNPKSYSHMLTYSRYTRRLLIRAPITADCTGRGCD